MKATTTETHYATTKATATTTTSKTHYATTVDLEFFGDTPNSVSLRYLQITDRETLVRRYYCNGLVCSKEAYTAARNVAWKAA